MEATRLNLLARDGMIAVTFMPALEPDQYAELHELSREAETINELSEVAIAAARRWGRTVHVD